MKAGGPLSVIDLDRYNLDEFDEHSDSVSVDDLLKAIESISIQIEHQRTRCIFFQAS